MLQQFTGSGEFRLAALGISDLRDGKALLDFFQYRIAIATRADCSSQGAACLLSRLVVRLSVVDKLIESNIFTGPVQIRNPLSNPSHSEVDTDI